MVYVHQHKTALIRFFQCSCSVFRDTGISASFTSKELKLGGYARQHFAMQFYKGVILAVTSGVQGPCKQLLTRSGLTLQEHSAIQRGCPFDHGYQVAYDR